jgi:ureidoglycolate lyase
MSGKAHPADVLVRPERLTAAGFRPFGDVIEVGAREGRPINEGTCRRFDDLAAIDVLEAGGRPLLSLFEAAPRSLPLRVRLLERHPLSSQAFVPLDPWPFLVVVAPDEQAARSGRVHAFLSAEGQGVNYRRKTWHHPLIALDRPSRFMVVDRGGPGVDCEEITVEAPVWVAAPAV